jgi:AbrB family looped-hinge helix DNA binding protein
MKLTKINESESCCEPSAKELCCCKVESVVSIDDRGQMVLPKEIRDKAEIHAGDKLAIISWENGDKVSCISLIKVEDFSEMVKGILGPMMKEMIS